MIGRDKDATWRGIEYVAPERGWSKSRVIWAFRNKRLPFRTMPPGHEHEVDWHDDSVAYGQFNLETGELYPLGSGFLKVGIEVMLTPADAEAPPSPIEAPLPPPPSSPEPAKRVSEADLRACILAIVGERQKRNERPLGEGALWKAVEARLGAKVSRAQFRQVRNAAAPKSKLPPGRQRKSAQ